MPRNAEPPNDMINATATRELRIFVNDVSFPLAWNASNVHFTSSPKLQGSIIVEWAHLDHKRSIYRIMRQIHSIYGTLRAYFEDNGRTLPAIDGTIQLGIRAVGIVTHRRRPIKVKKERLFSPVPPSFAISSLTFTTSEEARTALRES